MKKNTFILAVIAFLFSAVSVNAQKVKQIDNSEILTELQIKKEIPANTCNKKEEIKKSADQNGACKESKTISSETKKEFAKKEKENCTKHDKSKTSGTKNIRTCTANLASCCSKKVTN